MPRTLSGKVAVITGGSRGLGTAIARLLADEGADVAVTYVNSEARSQEFVNELQTRGARALALKADQGNAAEAKALIDTVMDRFGRLDILVANADLLLPGALDGPFDFNGSIDQQYAVNLTGVIAGIRAASHVMGEGGRIVAIGSALCEPRRVSRRR